MTFPEDQPDAHARGTALIREAVALRREARWAGDSGRAVARAWLLSLADEALAQATVILAGVGDDGADGARRAAEDLMS